MHLSYFPPPSRRPVLPPRLQLALRHALRHARPDGLTAERAARLVGYDLVIVAEQLETWSQNGEVDRSTDQSGEHVFHWVRRWPPRSSRQRI
jgi:hypothetical protein